jgi:hypothetical protein
MQMQEPLYEAPAGAVAPPVHAHAATGFSVCGCMKVEAKTANDAVFLAAAKKMIVCSFGVLAWILFTMAFPYGMTLYAVVEALTTPSTAWASLGTCSATCWARTPVRLSARLRSRWASSTSPSSRSS